jgi:Holliday junction resolvase RusA-like endonuclease
MTNNKQPKHQNPEWLFEQANNGLWYGRIAKLAGVKPPTIVKYMVKYQIFTAVPLQLTDNVNKRVIKKSALFAIVLMGNPVIKKNGNPTRNGMRLPNKNYIPYAEINTPLLEKLKKENNIFIGHPVTIQFLFYKDSNRRTDISNLYEAPQDVIVKAGILKDDNSTIIKSHHSDSRVLYDKEFPRTEMYFYKAANDSTI